MRTRIIVGTLSIVAAGAIGALGQHTMADHAEQQRQDSFTASCKAEGGTVHDMKPSQIVGATHDGGQKVAVRSSAPIRLCFEPTTSAAASEQR
jgi:hypothetical protein